MRFLDNYNLTEQQVPLLRANFAPQYPGEDAPATEHAADMFTDVSADARAMLEENGWSLHSKKERRRRQRRLRKERRVERLERHHISPDSGLPEASEQEPIGLKNDRKNKLHKRRKELQLHMERSRVSRRHGREKD